MSPASTASVARPAASARRVAGEAEAIELAAAIGAELAEGAAERDAERRLPRAELERLSSSGLLAITVPRELGGADVGAATVAQVVRLLAAGDPNVAQIPQSHFVFANLLKAQGDAHQRRVVLGDVLAGRRIANAQAEAGTKHQQDIRTRLRRAADGDALVLAGTKHYCTGTLFADWIPVLARDDEERLVVAWVAAGTAGLEIVDDWDGIGQRTTASGTVRLDDVPVDPRLVTPYHRLFDGPQLYGAQAQLLHAAIDVGIADGALAEAVAFVRGKSRPWFEAGVERAADDPLLIQRVGELAVSVRAAGALLAEAGRAIDEAAAGAGPAGPTAEAAGAASIAVAAAKVVADRAALEVASALLEVSGARASLASLGLDRHWRNARTHTLHDPVRWKRQHIGRYVLDGTLPPRHGQL